MAGTRGLVKFKTHQLGNKIMRDQHFDEQNKINENKINIAWADHTEILQNKKVDVYVQVNDVNVGEAAVLGIDVTTAFSGYVVSTGVGVEGVVLSEIVQLRNGITADDPFKDSDGDVVYGKLEEDEGTWTLKFYSDNDVPFSINADTVIDYRFVLRTSLLNVPVDAMIKGGGGFVQGATDAKAYMNLLQLMKDVYGVTGTLDNDGNANLTKALVNQITDLIADLASTDSGEGATMIGVVIDSNYEGTTAQGVLSELASRLDAVETGCGVEVVATHTRDLASANEYFTQKINEDSFDTLEERIVDVETIVDANFKAHVDRINTLETECGRYAFEAEGGETSVSLPSNKKAKPGSLFLSINGIIQTPGINYEETLEEVTNNVLGVSFAPEQLVEGDVVFMWYKVV